MPELPAGAGWGTCAAGGSGAGVGAAVGVEAAVRWGGTGKGGAHEVGGDVAAV